MLPPGSLIVSATPRAAIIACSTRYTSTAPARRKMFSSSSASRDESGASDAVDRGVELSSLLDLKLLRCFEMANGDAIVPQLLSFVAASVRAKQDPPAQNTPCSPKTSILSTCLPA